MNKQVNHKLLYLVTFLCAVVLLATGPAWSTQNRAGDSSKRFGESNEPYKNAIEKTGYYKGIVDGMVSILEDRTRRNLTYLVAKDVRFTYEGQEVDPIRLWPSGLVKLIIVNSEVVEIILLVEAS